MPARRKAPRRKLQAIVRRRGVPAAAAALATGISHAVRNRRQYQRVGEALQNAYQAGRTYLGKRRRTANPSRTIADPAAYQQNTESRFKSGRAIGRAAVTSRVVAGARESVVYQFRNYQVDGTATNTLVQNVSHYTDGTVRFFPAYLFDLTGCIQVANAPVVCKRPYCAIAGATDGLIKWQTQTGLDPNGAGTTVLQRIASPSGVASSSHSKSFLEWVSLKLSFMGATTRPTKFQVQLVQFRDAEMDPYSGTDGTTSAAHQAVWQSMMSRLTVNALHDWKNPDPTAIKVLATKVITFQPIETTEGDVRGHTHTIKWFHRINKLMDYRQGGNQNTDDVNYSSTKEIVNVSGENFSNVADSRNKVFLYISAYCPYYATSFDRTLHPSFEYNLTMKHSLIP